MNAKERDLLAWIVRNYDGDIVILAESLQEGTKTPDMICGERQVELKTTSGNLNTLDSLLRKAAKQAPGGCVVVNMMNTPYSLHEACRVALRRMRRSGLDEIYLLRNGMLQAHLRS